MNPEAARIARIEQLYAATAERILVLDGSWSAKIQGLELSDDEFRGDLFPEHPRPLGGNADLLCLTRPAVITELLDAYLAAGADIASTNTFKATAIGQSAYGTEDFVYEINLAAARLARASADRFTALDPAWPRWVAGSIGPTTRTLSMPGDVDDVGDGAVGFAELYDAYRQQAIALHDGGVDMFLVETVFDTLNAKAALKAILDLEDEGRLPLPIWISGTITADSERTLSGQTIEAFWTSVSHAEPFAVGLNCALGAQSIRPALADLAAAADTLVSAYPSAGLPDEHGEYQEGPELTSGHLREWAQAGLVNVVGGCCGTTPAHIRAIAEAVSGISPRPVPDLKPTLRVAGLEAFPRRLSDDDQSVASVGPDQPPFVSERTNVRASATFKRLILDGDYSGALAIAREEIEHGAQIIDVNMDDSLLDSEQAMTTFLRMAALEPEIARVPIMIDSSQWSVIEAGLKCERGKAIVNSISLAEGEEHFLALAREIGRYGVAVVVRALDEDGQSDSVERKVAICERAYDLLTQQAGFYPEDIIFNPGVCAAAASRPGHDGNAVAFIEAVWQIKERLPDTRVCGRVSEVSSFHGDAQVRAAMNSVFLHHAIAAGLDLAIVNETDITPYPEIEPVLRDRIEDVILNRRQDAKERLLAVAPAAPERRPRSTPRRLRHPGEPKLAAPASGLPAKE